MANFATSKNAKSKKDAKKGNQSLALNITEIRFVGFDDDCEQIIESLRLQFGHMFSLAPDVGGLFEVRGLRIEKDVQKISRSFDTTIFLTRYLLGSAKANSKFDAQDTTVIHNGRVLANVRYDGYAKWGDVPLTRLHNLLESYAILVREQLEYTEWVKEESTREQREKVIRKARRYKGTGTFDEFLDEATLEKVSRLIPPKKKKRRERTYVQKIDIRPFELYEGQATYGLTKVSFVSFDVDPDYIKTALENWCSGKNGDPVPCQSHYEFLVEGNRVETEVKSVSHQYPEAIFVVRFKGKVEDMPYDDIDDYDFTVIFRNHILQRETYKGKSSPAKQRIKNTLSLLKAFDEISNRLWERQKPNSPIQLQRIKMVRDPHVNHQDGFYHNGDLNHFARHHDDS